MDNAKAAEILQHEILIDMSHMKARKVARIKAALFTAIQSLKNTQWIPCTERFPEEDTDVLCKRKDSKDRVIASYSSMTLSSPLFVSNPQHGYWYNGDHIKRLFELDEIVAWMPIPDPYDDDWFKAREKKK